MHPRKNHAGYAYVNFIQQHVTVRISACENDLSEHNPAMPEQKSFRADGVKMQFCSCDTISCHTDLHQEFFLVLRCMDAKRAVIDCVLCV